MKKIVLSLLIILVSCEKENSVSDNFSTNEFVKLFPEHYVISNLEINNEESIFIYKTSNNNLKLSLLSKFGEKIWTKEHNLNLNVDNNLTFLNNNLITIYSNSENDGIYKSIFDVEGELVVSERIFDEPNTYALSKENELIYAVYFDSSNNTNNIRIGYIEFSLNGDLIRSGSFETANNITLPQDIIVKNNKIYKFGETDFNNFSHNNYSCEIFDLSGNHINTINTETQDSNARHSKLVLNNGNILMSIYNFENSPLDYSLRLFDADGNLIKSSIFKSIGNNLRISLFNNDMIALTGAKENSSNIRKDSQFVILNSNLEETYKKEFGSYNNGGGQSYILTQEFDNFYYLIGSTHGIDGDFDLPNNSNDADLYYFKLNK